MRIGLNGAEVPMSQAYVPLNMMINNNDYDPATGQVLLDRGTVMPLEKGPDADEFFLTFDTLGANVYNRDPVAAIPPGTPPNGTPQADIGVKTFEEINATMSQITGVSAQDPFVQNTYNTVVQSLPAVETLEAFLASHQVAIAQLAIEYCNSMVEDSSLRSSLFPGFNFNGPPSTALTPAGRDLLLEPLLDRALSPAGSPVASNPDRASVKAELSNLIDRLTTCGGSCEPDRTATVAKSACAAVTGSAAMLVQ
jgi:hypothetical protein